MWCDQLPPFRRCTGEMAPALGGTRVDVHAVRSSTSLRSASLLAAEMAERLETERRIPRMVKQYLDALQKDKGEQLGAARSRDGHTPQACPPSGMQRSPGTGSESLVGLAAPR